MKCPRCDVVMVNGIAIEPAIRDSHSRVMELKKTVTYSELKLIDILKCPICGYSDDGT